MSTGTDMRMSVGMSVKERGDGHKDECEDDFKDGVCAYQRVVAQEANAQPLQRRKDLHTPANENMDEPLREPMKTWINLYASQ